MKKCTKDESSRVESSESRCRKKETRGLDSLTRPRRSMVYTVEVRYDAVVKIVLEVEAFAVATGRTPIFRFNRPICPSNRLISLHLISRKSPRKITVCSVGAVVHVSSPPTWTWSCHYRFTKQVLTVDSAIRLLRSNCIDEIRSRIDTTAVQVPQPRQLCSIIKSTQYLPLHFLLHL
jgi:hypothetical protein